LISILALDLGTRTGWALYRDGAVAGGTWKLATEREIREQKKAGLDRCCELRPTRLQNLVNNVLPVTHLYFEDVQFATTTYQAHLWASLRTVLTLLHPTVKLVAVPVGTLKKFATGKGNATKEDMLVALLRAAVCPPNMDDNEVDARWLLRLAMRELNVAS